MTTSDTATDERWYVQFDSQEVRLMTLDELDEAFQQGLIHENTYLIKVGEKTWQTLAETLGGADEEEPAAEPEPEPAARPAPAPVQHASAAPIPAAQPMAQRPVASAGGGWPPAVASSAVGGGWPPVVSAPAASAAPASMAPAAASPSIPPMASGPRSMVPVVQDVSDLDIEAPFKSRKRGVALFAAAAVVALGGAGYGISRLDAPPAPPVVAAAVPTVQAAAALTPYQPPTPTPAANPTPAPAPEPAKAESDATSDSRLSDDMKKALLSADKERAQKKTARASAPRRSSARKSKGSSTALKGGGGTHDPLDPTL